MSSGCSELLLYYSIATCILNVHAYFCHGYSSTSSFATLWLVMLIVGVQLVGMIIQVSFSSNTRLATRVTTVLTVIGVALISMVVQVSLGPSASVLATPVRHAVEIRSTPYRGIHVHTLDQIEAHPKLE